jgi:hypothetical protein
VGQLRPRPDSYTELIAHIGRGEAACIAIAAQKGWLIASDEKKRFLREAIARVGVGRVLTTVDVFVLAIKAGLLTIEEADADKITLEGRPRGLRFTLAADERERGEEPADDCVADRHGQMVPVTCE